MKRFVFEFYPAKLVQWVRQRKIQLEQRYVQKKKQRDFRLQQLLERYRQLPPNDEGAFWRWVQELNLRERLLLPDLYAYLHDDKREMQQIERERLSLAILQSTKKSQRFFKRILNALYLTSDVEHLWHPLRQAYALNKKKIEKRMREEEKQLWVDFLLSKNPVRYLAEKAYHNREGIKSALQPYFLQQSKPFFMTVFLEILKLAEEHADDQFFLRNQTLFREIFVQRDERDCQRMVESMIRSCKQLDRVRALALWVYRLRGTYNTKPLKWSYVGDKEKIRFAQWIFRNQLEDFFVGVNKEHERFQYWKKFIPNMVDVVVIDSNRTLIMYFPDVVIIEVIGTGALYVYDTQTFRQHFQEKVDRYLEQKKQYPWVQSSFGLRREHLIDKSKVYKNGCLRHRGGWQNVFDNWLRTQLGWEVDERVLEAKMVKEDTD